MSPMTTGRIAFTGAALAVLVAAGSCRKPEAVQCGTGIFCPAGYQCAKHVAQCITGTCGNGNIDAGEICDDGGNLNGDVIPGEKPCSADCKSDESCGNGVRDVGTGEVCDCGVNPLTGKYGCDPVTATNCVMDGPDRCMSTGDCGNGKTDGTEQCDAGDGKPQWGQTCNIDCTNSRCGDGKTNPAALEECDGGNDTATNGQSISCNDNCTNSWCGDGRINPLDTRMPERQGKGEECDDGKTVGNSWNLACLPTCLKNVCGDGHRNTSNKGYEDCDSGPADATPKTDCGYGPKSCTLCSVCKNVAGKAHYCGDKWTDTPDEVCDQGSDNGTKTRCNYSEGGTCKLCSSNCKQETTGYGPFCGDNVVQSDHESCDASASVACGTCGAPGTAQQCQGISRRAADGEIDIVALDGLIGVTIKLAWDRNVGTNPPTTFEFTAQGGTVVTPNAVRIEIADTVNNTANRAAQIIQNSSANINAYNNNERIILTNKYEGWRGNTDIIIDVADPAADPPSDPGALSVAEQMNGGIGCRMGESCKTDGDCINANGHQEKCQNSICAW